ncbi:MAG: acyl-CoA dehydratase activase, partial [Dehalococcoidia bacterium]|nr:acyl-CoA dehydratase activase [Dehalococcoidia bacterium]
MFAGIDIGSVSSKAVVVDARGRVIAFARLPTSPDRSESGRRVYEVAMEQAGLKHDEIKYVIATGYGRRALKEANKVLPEIICHARGTFALFPETRTVIDIGGQDSKVIELDSEGRPIRFGMNDKCAAGTGRFLEVMAGVLGVSLDELGLLALRSTSPCVISSVCTVFAESEIVSLLSENRSKEDIASGLNYAIARRVVNMGIS